ncbi:hypothetical protein SB861_66100, partial [Paraburkholderia sp. SIMBA_049]
GGDAGSGAAVTGPAAGVVVAFIWRVPCSLASVFLIIVAAFRRRASSAPLISSGYEKIEIDY